MHNKQKQKKKKRKEKRGKKNHTIKDTNYLTNIYDCK